VEAEAPDPHWSPRSTIQNTLVKTATETHYGKRVNVEKRVNDRPAEISGRVYALDLSTDSWLASTTGGLLTSRDHGATWQGGPVMDSVDYLSVAAHGAQLAAARQDEVVLSTDAGQSWEPMGVPAVLTRIHCVAFSADGSLWLGAREGLYFTRDMGKTWLWVNRFPLNDVDDLSYDANQGKMLLSSRSSDQVYAIDPQSLEWKWAQTGYRINRVRAAGERLLAASLYDGVLVQPLTAGSETGLR
jgi:ligand-binding sensor domain-containing protein